MLYVDISKQILILETGFGLQTIHFGPHSKIVVIVAKIIGFSSFNMHEESLQLFQYKLTTFSTLSVFFIFLTKQTLKTI